MRQLPNKVDFLQIEEKWEKFWEEHNTYRYDWDDDKRPRYSIDTPPDRKSVV